MLHRPLHYLNEFKLANDLLNLLWSMLDASDYINDIVYNFNSMLFNVVDRHAPVKSRPALSTSHSWITSDVIDMLRSRDALFRKFMRSSLPTFSWRISSSKIDTRLQCELPKEIFSRAVPGQSPRLSGIG